MQVPILLKLRLLSGINRAHSHPIEFKCLVIVLCVDTAGGCTSSSYPTILKHQRGRLVQLILGLRSQSFPRAGAGRRRLLGRIYVVSMKQRREIERRWVVGRHGLPPSAARIRIVGRLIKVPPRLIVEAGLLLLIRTLPRQHASGEAFLAGDMRRWHWNLVDVFKAPLVQIQTDRVVRVRINPVIFIVIVDLDVLLVVISSLRELFMRILLT